MNYLPLIQNGDSSLYFGTYEGQKYGSFDTSCCWDFSGVEVLETHLGVLKSLGMIPQDTLDWCKAKGYIDEVGDFYLSRRWAAILSGVKDNGNYQQNFWNLVRVQGIVPNSTLPYDATEASKWINQTGFNNEYFNPSLITQDMMNLGKDFLTRFSVIAETYNGGYVKDISARLLYLLEEGSIQIGIPVPHDGSWNQVNVSYPIGRTSADHAVEMYKYNSGSQFPICIYDSYQPNLKNLSSNYYIPYITRARVTALQVLQPVKPPQFSWWMKFWFNVQAFFNGGVVPFPDVPVGGTI